MKQFDDIIKDLSSKHINTYNSSRALYYSINSKYDIISFNGQMIINPGDTMLLARDFIANIITYEPIYYIIDDIEHIITMDTRLLSFLATTKPIYFRNKTDKRQIIIFTRYFYKHDYENLFYEEIHDKNHYYINGEVYSKGVLDDIIID